jgi:large-conductance mechanosensitive channel
LNENSNKHIEADSININTKQVIVVICFIVLGVFGSYFANFHNGLSEKNEVWGTFGDYFGGILNPVIAAVAFYLIAKTYELQKKELEATRALLKVSTDAQQMQIKLAALTSLLNSVLMRMDILKSERLSLLQGAPLQPMKPDGGSALPTNPTNPIIEKLREQNEALLIPYLPQWMIGNKGTPEGRRFVQIESEIKLLAQKSAHL